MKKGMKSEREMKRKTKPGFVMDNWVRREPKFKRERERDKA